MLEIIITGICLEHLFECSILFVLFITQFLIYTRQ
jgi:hypothetical protein